MNLFKRHLSNSPVSRFHHQFVFPKRNFEEMAQDGKTGGNVLTYEQKERTQEKRESKRNRE